VLGGRLHHHTERHCDCIERVLLVLEESCQLRTFYHRTRCNLHLLKLVTGVDISTRPVRRSGRLGKVVNSNIRTAAAAPNSAAFRLSNAILIHFATSLLCARKIPTQATMLLLSGPHAYM